MRHHNPILHLRAAVLRAIRAWLDSEGFIEADVGALVQSPGAEVHTKAFATQGHYLHTSPEFAMKRLLAAGEDKIYFLGKVYRAGEEGPLHAPEFTMLEWYRAEAGYDAVMADALKIAQFAAETANRRAWTWKDRPCDPFAAATRLTVREAFERFTKNPPPHDPDAFAAALVTEIEPNLGSPSLTLLHEYPLSEAALAQRTPHDATVAERFELYACGVELANGYGELTDPAEQRARLIEAMADKQKRYGETWPIDERFLAALTDMPRASGCALGIDRLVMLAAGAQRLSQVLWES